MKSPSWKFTQIASFIVTLWVCITIIYTISVYRRLFFINNLMDDEAVYFCVEGNLSPCLLRWSYVTVVVFASRILFIVWWLKRITSGKCGSAHHPHDSYYHLLALGIPQEMCSICIDDAHSTHQRFVELNQCPHRFHKKCIDEWFSKKLQCPLCKKQYGCPSLVAPVERRANLRFRGHRNTGTDLTDEQGNGQHAEMVFGGIDALWG